MSINPNTRGNTLQERRLGYLYAKRMQDIVLSILGLLLLLPLDDHHDVLARHLLKQVE